MEKGKGQRLRAQTSHCLLPMETEVGASLVSAAQAQPAEVSQSCCQLDVSEYSSIPKICT